MRTCNEKMDGGGKWKIGSLGEGQFLRKELIWNHLKKDLKNCQKKKKKDIIIVSDIDNFFNKFLEDLITSNDTIDGTTEILKRNYSKNFDWMETNNDEKINDSDIMEYEKYLLNQLNLIKELKALWNM